MLLNFQNKNLWKNSNRKPFRWTTLSWPNYDHQSTKLQSPASKSVSSKKIFCSRHQTITGSISLKNCIARNCSTLKTATICSSSLTSRSATSNHLPSKKSLRNFEEKVRGLWTKHFQLIIGHLLESGGTSKNGRMLNGRRFQISSRIQSSLIIKSNPAT